MEQNVFTLAKSLIKMTLGIVQIKSYLVSSRNVVKEIWLLIAVVEMFFPTWT